jgi:hypothetical protein
MVSPPAMPVHGPCSPWRFNHTFFHLVQIDSSFVLDSLNKISFRKNMIFHTWEKRKEKKRKEKEKKFKTKKKKLHQNPHLPSFLVTPFDMDSVFFFDEFNFDGLGEYSVVSSFTSDSWKSYHEVGETHDQPAARQEEEKKEERREVIMSPNFRKVLNEAMSTKRRIEEGEGEGEGEEEEQEQEQDRGDKENHAPSSMDTIRFGEASSSSSFSSSTSPLSRILQGLENVQERVTAVERRISQEISTMKTLLSKFVDINGIEPRRGGGGGGGGGGGRGGVNEFLLLATPQMQTAIDSVKPLKYWGECLHFVLKRQEFETIIHWDQDSSNYWISSEENLYVLLASLKGSTPQRARESMKSRFFIKCVNEEAKRKQFAQNLLFELFENKKKRDYTSSSVHYPRVGTAPLQVTRPINKRQRLSDSEEEEEEGGGEEEEEEEGGSTTNGKKRRSVSPSKKKPNTKLNQN